MKINNMLNKYQEKRKKHIIFLTTITVVMITVMVLILINHLKIGRYPSLFLSIVITTFYFSYLFTILTSYLIPYSRKISFINYLNQFKHYSYKGLIKYNGHYFESKHKLLLKTGLLIIDDEEMNILLLDDISESLKENVLYNFIVVKKYIIDWEIDHD